ncbi:hypothetical protein FRC06_008607, partial [Ceratobasidium sp. 370]
MSDEPNPIYQVTDNTYGGAAPRNLQLGLASDPESEMFSETGSSYNSMSTLGSHEVA